MMCRGIESLGGLGECTCVSQGAMIILTPNGPRPGPMSGEPWTLGSSRQRASCAHHRSDDDLVRNLLVSILHNDITQMTLITVM
jgi:hypothetical protein